jgi:glucose/arabinose dehydrogenase
MTHRLPALGLVARAIVLVSIFASCTGAAGSGASTAAATHAVADVAPVTVDPDVAPGAVKVTGLPGGVIKEAAVVPAAYAVGHLAISLVRKPGTFSSPVLVTNAGDGTNRLFVVEQGGRIRIIDGPTAIASPFLDIQTWVSCCGERGLLGLAFDPAYKTNRRFFVDYTDKNGDTIIASYRASATDPNHASTTQTLILKIAQPYSNHNGGMLAFGKDGYLYIGMGDGGSAGDPGNRAQNKDSLLGKILRIDINHVTSTRKYSNPPTNPFVGKAGSDRVWAYGFRNPWRFSFDRTTGDLWVGDVGQNRYEEVDRATKAGGAGKGRNYGWRVVEGSTCYKPSSGCSKTGKTHPLATYNHSKGCAVVGGYVYRGTAYPAMAGAYLFGDYCSGRIWALKANGASSSQTPVQILSSGMLISSFGEGENGTLYLTDLANGGVYQIVGSAQ